MTLGDFCPSGLPGGEKLQRELSAALWEWKAKPQPFKRAEEKKKELLVSEKGGAASSPWLQSALVSMVIHVLGTAGMDQGVPLTAEVTARAKITNWWWHSAQPSSPAPT